MSHVVRILITGVLTLSVCSTPLAAQIDRATITGEVRDPSAALIPQAEVVVVSMDTGVLTRAYSNEVGLYTLANLPVGPYEVKISAAGFKTYNRAGLNLTVGQTMRLDVTLETGAIQDSVTVTADASLLKIDTGQVSTTIQSSVVTDLPLSFAGGRAVENFAYALTPAVEGDNWESYIAGAPAFSKEVLIDGISATAQIQGHIGESSPTMEAVQEFSVQTSGMSAEYGRTSGGVFNFALKSGTNEPHGSAYYYLRNEALNANNWMNNFWLGHWRTQPSAAQPDGWQQTYGRARDRQFLYGFSLGGPVYIPKLYNGKNRTFIFGAFEQYEQQRYQLSQTYDATVPSPAFLDGDFSQLLTNRVVGTDALGRQVYAGQIFNPTTMRQVGSRWVAEPFLGNQIPKSSISGMSAKIANIFRQQYQPMVPGALTNNSAITLYNDPWFHQTQLTLKADHAVSPNNKFSGSVIWTQRPRILEDQGGIWNPRDPGNVGGPFARSRKQEVTSRAVRFSNNWNIRPNLINTFTFAFNRYRNPSLSTQAGKDWNSFLGLSQYTTAGMFPEIDFGNPVNGIETSEIGYNASGFYVGNSYIGSDTLLWVKGRHAFKFGVQLWKQQINSHTGLDTLSYHFANSTTGVPGEKWGNQVGFGFASFLLGQVSWAEKNVPFDQYGRRSYLETFVQDDFKVSSRLTLNLGLRWEQAQPLHEKYGQWSNFDPNLTNSAYGVKGAYAFLSGSGGTYETNKEWKEFSPRIGVSYRASDKLVIRGGYGIYFSPMGINYWSGVPYGQYAAVGYKGTNTLSATGNLPRFQWDALGYKDNYKPAVKDPNALYWGVVHVDPNSLFQAYTQQYNVSLQYEFTPNLIAEATYLGNQGRRIHDGALYRNQPQRSAYENPAVNPTAWVSGPSDAAAAGVPYPYPGFSGYAGFALQPFPQVAAVTWGPIYGVGVNRGSSGYNSFQLQLTKRLSKGLAGQVSYNYSRAVGNVRSAFDESWDAEDNIQDIYNLSTDASTVLPYDQTHVLKGYLQYQLPFGKGRSFLATAPKWLNALVGGWDVTWIYRYNTGYPQEVTTNVWYPGWDGVVYADWNRGTDLSRRFNPASFNPAVQNASANRYFDQSAFSNPQNHKLGNGLRRYDALRGFGFSNEDIGVLKYFHITERVSLQLRGELLNIFNRHHYGDPNTYLGDLTTFGYVTGMSGVTGTGPRNVQIGLRLGF